MVGPAELLEVPALKADRAERAKSKYLAAISENGALSSDTEERRPADPWRRRAPGDVSFSVIQIIMAAN